MDEALGLPSEKAAKVALRTQQIIGEESGIPFTVDPLAGSYTIENMTDELITKSMKLIDRIDTNGGMLKCIEDGWVQSQIMDSAYKYQREVEDNERIIVGVNKYKEDEDTENEITKINEELIQEKIKNLTELKSKRGTIESYLDKLAQKATTEENLMPHILEGVKASVSIGEICNTLRGVWGEYLPKDII
jgi:methylmalonyl-CoA mutase N-terminal domain/subunit